MGPADPGKGNPWLVQCLATGGQITDWTPFSPSHITPLRVEQRELRENLTPQFPTLPWKRNQHVGVVYSLSV